MSLKNIISSYLNNLNEINRVVSKQIEDIKTLQKAELEKLEHLTLEQSTDSWTKDENPITGEKFGNVIFPK